jgi:hypothetical protein
MRSRVSWNYPEELLLKGSLKGVRHNLLCGLRTTIAAMVPGQTPARCERVRHILLRGIRELSQPRGNVGFIVGISGAG